MELVCPARGDMRDVMCLDSWCIGDPMYETMGLSGASGLWILGRPEILGGWFPVGLNILYKALVISPFFSSLLHTPLTVGPLLQHSHHGGLSSTLPSRQPLLQHSHHGGLSSNTRITVASPPTLASRWPLLQHSSHSGLSSALPSVASPP